MDEPQRERDPRRRLLMVVKSAHVYETELGYIRGVLRSYSSSARSNSPAW